MFGFKSSLTNRPHLSTPFRITVGLASLTASVLLVAYSFGLFPNVRKSVTQSRASYCESLAIHFSLLAAAGETSLMDASLRAIVGRNKDIQSVAVRKESGEVLLQVGDHTALWTPKTDGLSTDSQMFVPIRTASEPWGQVEICFQPLSAAGWRGFCQEPILQVILFVFTLGGVAYFLFLKRVLLVLNPSKAVPNRVRTALDTLTQGLLILDDRERIVLANESFSRMLGRSVESLVGTTINQLPWKNKDDYSDGLLQDVPWTIALSTAKPHTGVLMDLQVTPDLRRTFVVNAAPIFSEKQQCQGVLTSLEDVTPMELKKRELHYVIDQLHTSAKHVRQQNMELERLATIDPLTECLNRRAFFSQFDHLWISAERHSLPISCLMVDIDFFKSVNDNYGHAMGDEVLKKVAALLRKHARASDLVCRFGGEEFCVLMPSLSIDEAAAAAERLRFNIEAFRFDQLSVTASFGCATRTAETTNPQQMIEIADKSLYAAKRTGRNRVVRGDQIPAHSETDEAEVPRTRKLPRTTTLTKQDPGVDSLPFHAVAALLSALAFRHRQTAEHCRRVADLAVALAETRMSFRDCYVVETAALLHDIGKIGVPDHILLKSGPLNDNEWELMRRHDQIGLEIVRAAFSSSILSDILEARRAFFGGSPHQPSLPVGESIPMGSRILAIADAFDSMTHDSVYRPAMSREQAFAELRSCAGSQFDSDLVEEFIVGQHARRVTETPATTAINKESAIDIGAQIERLVTAIDDQNIDGLKALAERLQQTAALGEAHDIAAKAHDLRTAVVEERELLDVLVEACELVQLCRSAQSTILTAPTTNKITLPV